MHAISTLPEVAVVAHASWHLSACSQTRNTKDVFRISGEAHLYISSPSLYTRRNPEILLVQDRRSCKWADGRPRSNPCETDAPPAIVTGCHSSSPDGDQVPRFDNHVAPQPTYKMPNINKRAAYEKATTFCIQRLWWRL